MEKVKEIIEVTEQEFVNVIINEVETKPVPTFLSITSEVPVTSMVKKCKEDGSINPYYKEITKEVTKTYLLVTDYNKRVNNNINKEGIDEVHDLKELKGRRHVSKSVLVDNETNSIYSVTWFNRYEECKTNFVHRIGLENFVIMLHNKYFELLTIKNK